ncbi:purine-cytosine permease family protein, partial [Acinetobacter seifertii]|uniref:purine-cytosine permease family protein n=1 Tax=Acinetobacter seifertii TaxID=1530123 RepID=UPI0039C89273
MIVMKEEIPHKTAPQRVIRSRREFNTWVIDESIEDYALRYAPKSVRRWSLFTIGNTAFSTISFMAMELIGATLLWQYGFDNALWATFVVCSIIFLTSWPISYYAAKYNLDIDLLTRGAGFGYIGSTITSLIYASFTFIFFAFEASIMALALELTFKISLAIGYLISALVILPLVIKGIGFINKVQTISQPLFILLIMLPWIYVIWKHPEVMIQVQTYTGVGQNTTQFNFLHFG